MEQAVARHVLTAVEFDVLWEWLRLGAPPAALRLDPPSRQHEERAKIITAGWQAMRDRGLADAVGPNPALVRLLRVLASPAASVELRMWTGRSLRAVAAERGSTAVIAVRQDETVAVYPSTSLSCGLADVLPPLPAAPGEPLTVAAGTGLLRSKTRGQLSALALDRRGVLRRLRSVLGVLDSPDGRYLVTRHRSADGLELTTLTPCDLAGLRIGIDELLAAAQRTAGQSYSASR